MFRVCEYLIVTSTGVEEVIKIASSTYLTHSTLIDSSTYDSVTNAQIRYGICTDLLIIIPPVDV